MTPKKQNTKTEPAPTTMAQAPQAPKPIAAPPTTQPQPPTVTKQQATVARLKEAWTQKGINLDQLTERQDGKFILLQPTQQWPVIRVGPTGGVELPQIRSYAKAWDAAVDGLAIFQKQQARDQKKSTATAAPAQTKPQPPAPAAKPESPASKKAKDHQKLEASLA